MDESTSHKRTPLFPGGHPCAHCGAPCPANYKNRQPRKFCSRTCAQRGWARENYDTNRRVPKPMYGHPCAHCGKPTPEKKVGGKPRKYCSRECATTGNAAAMKARGYGRQKTLEQYGLTLDDYEAMRTAQGDRCAICGTSEPGSRSGAWHVDHSHATGVTRALLCAGCNTGLGCFRDDPDVLRIAAAYLEATPCQPSSTATRS